MDRSCHGRAHARLTDFVFSLVLSSIFGRRLARDAIARLGGPIGLTASSMAVGAVVLLAVSIAPRAGRRWT
jgi:hypothetical protein